MCVSRTMEYFCDVQGFLDNYRNFIVKELSIISSDHGKTLNEHYLFKPPFPFNQLSIKMQKMATWLRNAHHGLDWNCGIHNLEQIQSIFAKITVGAIYVKGEQKVEWIKPFVTSDTVKIINLEKCGCPRLREHGIPMLHHVNIRNIFSETTEPISFKFLQ